MALARLSLLKDRLKLGGSGLDDHLKSMLVAATAAASTFCNRDNLELNASITEYHNSYGEPLRDRLYTRDYPLNSITTIKENYGTSDEATISSGDYTVFTEGVVRFDNDFPDTAAGAFNTVEVVYSAGYTTTNWDTDAITVSWTVPADLEMAVLMIAEKLHLDSKKGDSRAGIASLTRDGESVSYGGGGSTTTTRFELGIPIGAQTILYKYLRPQI